MILLVTLLILSVLLACAQATKKFYPGTVIYDYFEENINRIPLDWGLSMMVTHADISVHPFKIEYGDKDYESSFYDYPPKYAEIGEAGELFYASKRLPDILDISTVPRPLVLQFGAKMQFDEEEHYSEGHVVFRLTSKKDVLNVEMTPQEDFALLFGVVFSTEGEYILLETNTGDRYVGTTSHLFVPDGDAHSYTLELSAPLASGKGGRSYKLLRDQKVAAEGVLADLGDMGDRATVKRTESYYYAGVPKETSLFEYDYEYDKTSRGLNIAVEKKYNKMEGLTSEGIKMTPIVDANGDPNILCLSEQCGYIKAPLRLIKDANKARSLLSTLDKRYPVSAPSKRPKNKWTEDVEIIHPVDYIAVEAATAYGQLDFGGLYLGVDFESARKLHELQYAPGVEKSKAVVDLGTQIQDIKEDIKRNIDAEKSLTNALTITIRQFLGDLLNKNIYIFLFIDFILIVKNLF